MKFLLILLIPSISFANVQEDIHNKMLEAWAKQSGFEKEITSAGDFLYYQVPEKYKKPLAIFVGIVDSINRREIKLDYKWSF